MNCSKTPTLFLKKKLIESKPTDHVGVTGKTAVDLSSRLPEAVFFRWPLVNENRAMEKYCKFGDK